MLARPVVSGQVEAQTHSDDRRAPESLSKKCPPVSASIVAGAWPEISGRGPANVGAARLVSRVRIMIQKEVAELRSPRRFAAHTGHEPGRGGTIGIGVVVWR